MWVMGRVHLHPSVNFPDIRFTEQIRRILNERAVSNSYLALNQRRRQRERIFYVHV